MTGVRTSLAVADGDADRLVDLAVAAETVGLDGLWVRADGDPAGALTALAAVAGRTRDVRLGAFLALGPDSDLLRLAEDVGVLDQIAGGRLELVLVRPPGADRDAVADAWTRMLGAWTGWRTSAGEVVVVAPRPAQPWLPRLVLDDVDLAARVAGGVALSDPSGAAPSAGRRVLLRPIDRAPAVGASAESCDAAAASLRRDLEVAAADELVLTAMADELDPARLAHLAATLAPALRSAAGEQRYLLDGAVAWTAVP